MLTLRGEKALIILNNYGVKMRKHIDTLKYFIDNHSDLIIIFESDYIIRFINDAYCKIFGKTFKELKGRNFLSLIVKADRDKVIDSLSKLSEKENYSSYQERINSVEGIKWIEWKVKGRFKQNGRLLDYFAVGRDITQQKLLQKELEITKNRHEDAELIGNTGNWEFNIAENTFWGSIGSKKIYGFPLDNNPLSAEDVESRILDRENVHQSLVDLIEIDIPYDLEFEILPLNQKEPKVISSKAILIKDSSGNPLKVKGVIHDITLRKNAEEELRKSEELYRSLIETASDSIYLMNSKGKIVRVNQKACDMMGYSREEFMQMTIADVDKNFSLDLFHRFWEEIAPSAPTLFATSHTHKDGHEILLEISGVKFELQDEIYYYGIARDITKRKEIEEELKTSEERFKLAVEGTNDGLWDWDLRTNYAYHSDRFATMLGYEPDELPYTSAAWSDLIHPDDLTYAQKKVDEYLSGKIKVYKSTFRMLCKEGYFRWITGRGMALWDENGKPNRFLGFNTDITTRKNSERAFIKSEEKYHMLYDTLSEGVIFFNKNADVIDANPAAQMILNFSLLEIRGSKLENLKWKTIHEDGSDYAFEDHPVSLSLSQGKHCQNVIMGLLDAKSNTLIWLTVNSAPIYDNDSDLPTGAYTIFSDITTKKQAKDQLRKTNETLLAAQDMAKIGCWTYDIKTGNLTWSEQMFTIFGLDPTKDAPNYEQHKNLIHSDDLEMFDESVKKCRQGVPNNLKLKINYPDNITHHIISLGFPRYNDNGEVYEIYGTSQDITEFKQKEIELEQHRNHLELLVQQRTEKLEKQNNDLRHYHELFIAREFRIKELKNEIQALKEEVAKNKSIT